jgi:hypothetical protein
MIVFGFFAGWIMVVGAANELRLLGESRDWAPRRGVITQSYARSIRGPLSRLHIDVEFAGVYLNTGEGFHVGRLGYGIENGVATRLKAARVAAEYPVKSDRLNAGGVNHV